MADPVSTLIASIPGLASAATAIASATDTVKRNAQLIEFQNALIKLNSEAVAIQTQNSSLARRNQELEDVITRLKNWESERTRYRLCTIFSGSIAYALLRSRSDGEPPHFLCAQCFENSRRVFLNFAQEKNGWYWLRCPECAAQIPTDYRSTSEPKYAEEYLKDA